MIHPNWKGRSRRKEKLTQSEVDEIAGHTVIVGFDFDEPYTSILADGVTPPTQPVTFLNSRLDMCEVDPSWMVLAGTTCNLQVLPEPPPPDPLAGKSAVMARLIREAQAAGIPVDPSKVPNDADALIDKQPSQDTKVGLTQYTLGEVAAGRAILELEGGA